MVKTLTLTRTLAKGFSTTTKHSHTHTHTHTRKIKSAQVNETKESVSTLGVLSHSISIRCAKDSQMYM